nr:MBL fold metallo-hydrolase [Lysobacter sp.]
DRAALAAYGDLLQQFRDRIAAMKADGLSVEQVIAANPTAATDEAMGQGFISPERLVQSIYETL